MGAPSANNNSAATTVRMGGQQMQQRLFGTPNSPQKQQIHQHQHQFVFHRFPAPPAPSIINTTTGDFIFGFTKLSILLFFSILLIELIIYL
jgi:hypothetical protein